MKRIAWAVLSLLLLAGCAPDNASGVKKEFFAMDTLMSVTAMDGKKGAPDAAEAEVKRLEVLLSRTLPDSEISRLNAAAGSGAPVSLSAETAGVLRAALSLAARTGGAFDPTVAPVMDAWGFTKETRRVPPPGALEEARSLVDCRGLTFPDGPDSELDRAALTAPGMAVDLGGISKGFAAGYVCAALKEQGVTSALVDLGGNITVMGKKPDGSPWRIAVRDPQNTEGYLGVLSVSAPGEAAGCTISTSGGYERFFEEDGVRYHHIIDPDTGYPADTGLLSVTVLSEDCAAADALSTALFVMGEARGLEFWRASSDFEMVMVCADGRVLVTGGLEDVFQLGGEEDGYTRQIIGR